MKMHFRFLGVMVLALTAAVTAAGSSGTRNAAASGPWDVSCEIPNYVSCTFHSPFGIKHVVVTMHHGGAVGDVDIIDKDYNGCPGSVQEAWDSISPNVTFVVETCSPAVGGDLTLELPGHDSEIGQAPVAPSKKLPSGSQTLELKPLRRH